LVCEELPEWSPRGDAAIDDSRARWSDGTALQPENETSGKVHNGRTDPFALDVNM